MSLTLHKSQLCALSSCCGAGKRLQMCRTAKKNLGFDSCASHRHTGCNDSSLFSVWISCNCSDKEQEKDKKSIRTVSETTIEKLVIVWKQITNQVWKNLLLRKRHPVKLGMEVVLPVLLVGARVVVANVDSWFSSNARPPHIASSMASKYTQGPSVLCLGLDPVEVDSDTGALTANILLSWAERSRAVLTNYLYRLSVKGSVPSSVGYTLERTDPLLEVVGLIPGSVGSGLSPPKQ